MATISKSISTSGLSLSEENELFLFKSLTTCPAPPSSKETTTTCWWKQMKVKRDSRAQFPGMCTSNGYPSTSKLKKERGDDIQSYQRLDSNPQTFLSLHLCCLLRPSNVPHVIHTYHTDEKSKSPVTQDKGSGLPITTPISNFHQTTVSHYSMHYRCCRL